MRRFIAARPGSSPTESWLASMLDHLAGLEAERGWSRPVTFTNWLTTDPLEHPYEPLDTEDLVGIDATNLRATSRWPGGFFASYHVYPYYPDFLRYQPAYKQYRRSSDGKRDAYAGYLAALRRHHGDQAVMVTEFGVPTGRGIAHRGPGGRDQGGHSEEEAGRIDAELMRDIKDEGFAGAMLFEWADEWFKDNWNQLELEQPRERDQLWLNRLDVEENFGVIAAEPGVKPTAVLDGRADEWSENGSRVVAEQDSGPVRQLSAAADEGDLYLQLSLDRSEGWRKDPITLGLDVRPGSNRGLPGSSGTMPEADVMIRIGPGDRAVIRQAAWTDSFSVLYGLPERLVPVEAADLERGSGRWVSPRVMLNRQNVIPATGQPTPVEWLDIGELPWGPTDPSSPSFDARNMAFGEGSELELKIPWPLLTVSDPSSRQVYGFGLDGADGPTRIGGFQFEVRTQGTETPLEGSFTWDGWNEAEWHERRKQSWPALQKAFTELQR